MPSDRKHLVLIYSHVDRNFVRRSALLHFLRGVAKEMDLDFWWDEQLVHPLWDQEIRLRLEDAAAVVCLVSQPFLNSSYVQDVEAKRAYERLIEDDICVLAIMYQACLWEGHEWLKKVHHLPQNGYVHGHNNQPGIFFDAAQFLQRCLGRKKVFSSGQALYTLRRLPDSTFAAQQLKALKQDSVARADRFVQSRKLQERICKAARRLLEDGEDRQLSKRQLEELDRRFLAEDEGRRPDAKKIRWVLRAHGLHPQGRTWG